MMVRMIGFENTRFIRYAKSTGLSLSASFDVASPVSKLTKPASDGLSFTRIQSTTNMMASRMEGIRKTQYHGMYDRIQPPTVRARKYPDEIIIPNTPPKMPRSLTWLERGATLA